MAIATTMATEAAIMTTPDRGQEEEPTDGHEKRWGWFWAVSTTPFFPHDNSQKRSQSHIPYVCSHVGVEDTAYFEKQAREGRYRSHYERDPHPRRTHPTASSSETYYFRDDRGIYHRRWNRGRNIKKYLSPEEQTIVDRLLDAQ